MEIMEYLARHPEAQDTADGILQWWVVEECVRKWTPVFSTTLAGLVELGLLSTEPAPGGVLRYRASPAFLRTLQQPPPAPAPDA